MNILTVLALVSALSFTYYGISILVSRRMKLEMERLGKSRLRVLLGTLQLAGALGLVVGFVVPVIGGLAALGIATLMLLGVSLRIRNRDSFLQIVPAFFFCCLNAYLSVLFFATV